jgi:hypothetical protein
MYVKIQARDKKHETTPQTSYYQGDGYNLAFRPEFNQETCESKKYLEITGKDYHWRKGTQKEIEIDLTMKLSSHDISKIVEKAIRVRMFSAPGIEDLLKAFSSLSKCLQKLNLETKAGVKSPRSKPRRSNP